ncbi:MAG: hypothetical protein ACI8RZ_004627 [Myxococcota bacterium]|jgi:hypothetical protein
MLPVLLNLAVAAPPQASAIVSSDGQYSLILRSDVSWEEAEISISGDGAEDLGPIEAGAEVRIDGTVSGTGVIWVNLNAAIDDDTGINWVFSVDPEVVPARSPKLDRMSRRTLRWCPLKRRKG